ncbi:MAG: DUF370 domain-containing protein [Clostridium sp.]|nr:DUF370 domain-containing protein [Clostridium sp.]
MYLHLGEDVVIPINNLISMIDINSGFYGADTNHFLTLAREDGFVIEVNDGEPKTIIISEENKKSRIYLTSISTRTLNSRVKKLNRKYRLNKEAAIG